MKISRKWLILMAVPVAALTFSSCGEKKSSPGTSSVVADDDISLRTVSVFSESPTLAAPTYNQKDPGENKKLERAYYNAPPMIPHSTEDTTINAAENSCLDCHDTDDKDTPAYSAAHRIKPVFNNVKYNQAKNGATTYFTGKFTRATTINGNRYLCEQCHAPQATNLEPLVQNEFSSTTPKEAQKDILDQLNEAGSF